MAEMMLFNNADTFNRGRANGLAGLAFRSQGTERQTALGKLAGIDPSAASLMQRQFGEQDKDMRSETAKAMMMHRSNPELVSAIYTKRFVPLMESYFPETLGKYPQVIDEKGWQVVEQFANAGGNQQAPADVRSIQWKLQQAGYQPGTPEYQQALNVALKLAPGATAEKYTTNVTPSGAVVQGSNKGGFNVTGQDGNTQQFGLQGENNQQGASNDFYNNVGSPPPDNTSQGFSARKATELGVRLKGMGVPDEIIRQAQDAVMNAQVPDGAVYDNRGGQRPLPALSKPNAPDTAIAYDVDGNAMVVDKSQVGAIPGAVRPGSQMSPKQKADLANKRKKEVMMINNNASKTNETIGLIDRILNADALGGVTGMGAIGSKIPGTKWADSAAMLETLKARSAFGSLSEMRANSPTGGALGSVSERELFLLQNAETQLNNAQSPEAFKLALKDYKRILLDSQKRMVDGLNDFYQDNSQPQPQAPAKAPNNASPVKIASKQQYDALPSGARYIGPDGHEAVKK